MDRIAGEGSMADYMERITTNIRSHEERTLFVSTGIVAVLGLVGMVSAAYAADHINKSSSAKTDKNLETAYKWSVVAAVVAGAATVGMVGLFVKTALRKL